MDDLINRPICCDCFTLFSQLPNNSVDMVLTDIPYGEVNSHKSNGLRNFDKGDADKTTFSLRKFVLECIRVSKKSIYIFCGTEQVSIIRRLMVRNKLSTRLCILHKSNPAPTNGTKIWLSGVECCVFGKKAKATFNEHCKDCVWRYPSSRNKLHPTQKPLPLFEYIIRASSNEGDIVCDPCSGSFTTAVAALSLNRRFIGCDLNPEYVKIGIERLSSN